MKVVILAGGKGTRLSEYTKLIPKPMMKIVKVPIIVRIIKYYQKFGFKDFIIATGYKKKVIEQYFSKNLNNLNIKTIDTGLNSMTGGRIKFLKNFLNSTFLLTYGDGLSNVNLKKLIKFHKKNKYFVTLTAVRPPARFGGIKISGKRVKYFKEKSKLDEGWINGGFFVMEPKIFGYIKNSKTILEQYPLEKLSSQKNWVRINIMDFGNVWTLLEIKNFLKWQLKIKKFNERKSFNYWWHWIHWITYS